ncbi:MAG: SLC13 family permease, partial [Acidobacteria bacterium]|nr:SLC13 family permease [Acidobacteriota bacterium]
MLAALLIFLGTYFVMAWGHLPGSRIDRTGAAIIGASLMIGFGVLSMEEAYRAVDYNTIILLFGMMIVVANLRLSGFFAMVGARVLEHLHHPLGLLAAIILVSGVFSAFFVNDTMCIVLTPLVLEIALGAGLNPVPYLLAVAMASNIGSVATITGNPQNMMIGAFSQIPYRSFAGALSPIAAIGLIVAFGTIALIYRREFSEPRDVEAPPPRVRVNRFLMGKSLAVAVAMIVFFFLGWPVPKVALLAG